MYIHHLISHQKFISHIIYTYLYNLCIVSHIFCWSKYMIHQLDSTELMSCIVLRFVSYWGIPTSDHLNKEHEALVHWNSGYFTFRQTHMLMWRFSWDRLTNNVCNSILCLWHDLRQRLFQTGQTCLDKICISLNAIVGV